MMEHLNKILANLASICERHSFLFEVEHKSDTGAFARAQVIYVDTFNAPAAIHYMLGGIISALPLVVVLHVEAGQDTPIIKQLALEGRQKDHYHELLITLFRDFLEAGYEVIQLSETSDLQAGPTSTSTNNN